MESAPLSLAYSHARNAVHETQKANPIAASEEHDLAAGEFANAAKSTGDPEALRTLRLLEQHHQRLAELLKFKPDKPSAIEELLEQEHGLHAGNLSTVLEEKDAPAPTKTLDDSARHASRHASLTSDGRQHREPSSSLASSLALQRGIQPNRQQQRRSLQSPSSPALSPQNADGRIASTGEDLRASKRISRGHDRRSSVPLGQDSPYRSSSGTGRESHPSPMRSTAAAIPPSIVQPGTDDAFTRFYSTVESLGTKLSAALAFTGLPLSSPNPEEDASGQEAEKKPIPSLPRDKSHTVSPNSPDISRLFSRAAMRAIREDGGPGVAESFYVVPTSGGTMSYAGMLQGQRHSSGLSEAPPEEEFVDASEVPVHGSFEGEGGGAGRSGRSRAGSLRSRPAVSAGKDRGKDDVRRELEYWKAMAKDTGERLKAFEMNAQRESIMAASIYRGGGARSRHHSPESVRSHATPSAVLPSVPQIPAQFTRTSTGTASEPGDGVKDQKIRELEEEIERAKEESKRCQKENRKLMAVVEKYRKRFEDLKENARERMRVQEEKARAQQAHENEDSRADQMMG